MDEPGRGSPGGRRLENHRRAIDCDEKALGHTDWCFCSAVCKDYHPGKGILFPGSPSSQDELEVAEFSSILRSRVWQSELCMEVVKPQHWRRYDHVVRMGWRGPPHLSRHEAADL